MLDRRFIVANVDAVKQNCADRGVEANVDRLVELELLRREKQKEVEQLNRQANEVSKSIGKAPPELKETRKEEGRKLREHKERVQAEVERLEGEVAELQGGIPNMSHPQVPRGADEKSNLELQRGKHKPRDFDFPVRDHVELGERLDLIDFEGGAKIAGHGFYFLKNEAALLELALQQFAIQLLIQQGFTPLVTPDLAYTEILQGTGYIPRGPETQIYSIENSNLNLVATAEITLGGLMAGEILDADQLPVKLCGISHCFRTEAGAAGRASRGLYR
ncbi:MAG: serine--tRNA ligase, partial [Planctomycetota bacterium]